MAELTKEMKQQKLGPAVEYRLVLKALAKEIHEVNTANGFDEVCTYEWQGTDELAKFIVPTKLALIHSEVSEALEEFRKGHRIEAFGTELADIIIRTLDLAASLGIDIGAAVEAKVDVNRQRAFKHGERLI